MAAGTAVWGIDIGQCALKALRCKISEDGEKVVADAFDFIEYPKILSQPEANREELIHEALEQFLSRNSVRGDKVAISVSGQSGLARFFKPPPVEAKKIPDIVKYEARQQIPFALEEVIWDYQQMPGGEEEEGVALDTEVGLFAMKREHVFRALEPFEDVGIELDMVQLSPLSIYNFASYDLMTDLPPAEDYDPEEPPDSMVILSLGTDATDLVVTNGFRVWQRSIPLGGNHFTRQLTSELKLTFAKAEHLKRNARQAEDPKTIFKAMRGVFNDLVTEVQRSISYFQSIDRKAKLTKIVCVGNAAKLPGLQQYVATNLDLKLLDIEKLHKLRGAKVLAAPAFKDNLLAFPVCYGLCLQGLGKSNVYTSLLPQEILRDRLVREKKPWALAAAAVILLGFCGFLSLQWRQVSSADQTNKEWKSAMGAVSSVTGTSSNFDSEFETRKTEKTRIDEIGYRVVGTDERRLVWPDLLKTIDACLPRDATATGDVSEDPLTDRPELYVQSIECRRFTDLSQWFTTQLAEKYQRDKPAAPGAPPSAAEAEPGDDADGTPSDDEPTDPSSETGDEQPTDTAMPSGEGWVVELRGYHFHNEDPDRANRGRNYLRKTLVKNLEYGTVRLPDGPGGEMAELTTRELGIGFPVLIDVSDPYRTPNPLLKKAQDPRGGMSGFGEEGMEAELMEEFGEGGYDEGGFGERTTAPPPMVPKEDETPSNIPESVRVCTFTLQFSWKPTTVSQRRENEKQLKEAASDDTGAE